MVMTALREGASGGVLKFFLFGLLVLAVGGLVLMDVGGFFRGGVRSTDVAKIGSDKIAIQQFDRTLRRTLAPIGLSPAEAYRMGYVNQILQGEIRNRLLAQGAYQSGLKVSEERITQEVRSLIAPLLGDGRSPRDVLEQVLRQQGLSEAEFMRSISENIAIGSLVRSVSNPPALSPLYAAGLHRAQKEERSFEYVAFTNESFKLPAAPSEEELQRLYEATGDLYTNPERRLIKAIQIDNSAFEKTLEITEEELRDYYEANEDLYDLPEKRVLAQALLEDESQALSVFKNLRKNGDLEKAVQTVTGQKTAYLGADEVSAEDLLEEVRDAASALSAEAPYAGPVETPLGFYVLAQKSYSPARMQAFDEVRGDILSELKEARTLDYKYELANTLDDLLAGGATPGEIENENLPLLIIDLPLTDRYAQDVDFGALVIYQKDIIDAAFTLAQGEGSAVMEMADGQFLAVYVEEIQPESPKAFDEVRKTLAQRWIKSQKRDGNREKVLSLLAALDKGEKQLPDIGALKRKKSLSRDAVAEALGVRAAEALFTAELAQPLLLNLNEGFALAKVTAYSWPKSSSEEYQTYLEELGRAVENEMLGLYVLDQYNNSNVTVNERLLQGLYGAAEEQF